MDLRHLAYCRADSPFYEPPGVYTSTGFALADAPLPAGWTRTLNAEWVILSPPDVLLADQGWKVHVSGTLDNAARILDVVAGYCTANGIWFKFLKSPETLQQRNSKYGDRGSSGKFITVYPADDRHLATILSELGDLLEGEEGPYILSDLRWRSGPLYVRYGAFVAELVRTDSGESVLCLRDPDGHLVPDVRGPGFRPPPWVTLPEVLAEAVRARRGGTLGDFPFRADKALHFSNGGGVYRATDTRDGTEVLLKEARPMAGLDETGRDAVARLGREHWALAHLAGIPEIPRVVDFRRGREHYFLAREFVAGEPLAKEIHVRNPLVTEDASAEAFTAYRDWALAVLDRIDSGLRAMHERGVVFGDLHPNNILIRPDGSVGFIDLETATPIEERAAQVIGAPGFRAPAGVVGSDADRYAMGCLRLGVFVPLTVTVSWGAYKVEELLALVTETFGVPESFADQVRADLGTAPPEAAVAVAEPVAGGLEAGILAVATPDHADRLFPGDIDQYLTPGGGLSFAYGAAGVLWALALAGADVPSKHLDWLTERALTWDDVRPGFYDGLSGVAYAVDRLGRPDTARELFDRALRLPADSSHGTVLDGSAGIGLTALHFATETDDQDLLGYAYRLADQLAERSTGRSRPGLLHGSAGDALFLLRLYEFDGDEQLLRAAVRAARAALAEAGWNSGTEPAEAVWRVPSLSSGGAGLAMVLHDLAGHTGDPDLIAARDTLRGTFHAHFMANAGLFRGRAGVIVALQHLHDGTDETTRALHRHLRCFQWHTVGYEGRPHLLGEHGLRLSTDLATGTAGALVAAGSVAQGRTLLPFMSSPAPRPQAPVLATVGGWNR